MIDTPSIEKIYHSAPPISTNYYYRPHDTWLRLVFSTKSYSHVISISFDVKMADNQLDYVGVTERGKPLVFYNGYSYIRDKRGRDGVVYWKCSQCKEKCAGRLKTENDVPQTETGEHNHTPDATAMDVAKARKVMRERKIIFYYLTYKHGYYEYFNT